MRFRILSIMLVLTLAVSACDASTLPGTAAVNTTSVAQAPGAAGTPEGARTPRPNFTPGAQGTRGAPRSQATPGTASTPSGNTSATPAPSSVAPTAVAVNPITQTNGTAPTAVPIPSVIIPTPLPPAGPNTSPPGTSPSAGGTPASNPNQPTDKGGNPLPPLVTPVSGSNTSGTEPQATPIPLITPGGTGTVSAESLRGQIVFFSDRGGLVPQLYVMNADGSNQRLCNCSDVLPALVQADVTSPDKQQFLFVKQAGTARNPDFQIWAHNNQTNQDVLVTGAAGTFPGVDYDPTWSPDSRHIAWVTQANGIDEIYIHDRVANTDERLIQSHGEWYKHPSYSPDGSQLTYWTNLGNLNQKQVWVINADGSGAHNISGNAFNDWDPIWVK